MHVIDRNSYRSVKTFNQRVCFLVLHYTAEDFAESMDSLTGKTRNVSVHYVVPDPTDPTYTRLGFEGVRVFNLVDEDDRAWHAGVSAWDGRSGLNDTSIGIEIVYKPTEGENDFVFPPYNPDQIQAVKDLCQNILQRYPGIKPTYVVGHSDIAYKRKSDPGAAFPWKDLYDAGIGAWYDPATVEHYERAFHASGLPDRCELLKKFAEYGYSIADAHDDHGFFQLTRAFQLHFRQNSYDGVMDTETAAILYALVDKYAP